MKLRIVHPTPEQIDADFRAKLEPSVGALLMSAKLLIVEDAVIVVFRFPPHRQLAERHRDRLLQAARDVIGPSVRLHLVDACAVPVELEYCPVCDSANDWWSRPDGSRLCGRCVTAVAVRSSL